MEHISSLFICVIFLQILLLKIEAAPALSSNHENSKRQIPDSYNRFLINKIAKKWDDGSRNSDIALSEPMLDRFETNEPFAWDKWHNLFLPQHQRTFFPSSYVPDFGFEKRRRSLDDMQPLDNEFTNNFEWNYNRL